MCVVFSPPSPFVHRPLLTPLAADGDAARAFEKAIDVYLNKLGEEFSAARVIVDGFESLQKEDIAKATKYMDFAVNHYKEKGDPFKAGRERSRQAEALENAGDLKGAMEVFSESARLYSQKGGNPG